MSKKPLTIFIVDDNKPFGLVLKSSVEKTLQQENAQVIYFEDGESCISSLELKPNLVIVDYHLNGSKKEAMDGLQVIDTIKKTNSETDFIMVTIDEHTELFLRSKEHNIYDYLTKGPITGYKLGLSIEHWLKSKN